MDTDCRPSSLRFEIDANLAAQITLEPIDHLIEAAKDGFRLYELFRLDGPSDLVHYVDVEVRAECRPEMAWWPELWIHGAPPYLRTTSILRPPWERGYCDDAILRRRWQQSGLAEQAAARAQERWPDI